VNDGDGPLDVLRYIVSSGLVDVFCNVFVALRSLHSSVYPRNNVFIVREKLVCCEWCRFFFYFYMLAGDLKERNGTGPVACNRTSFVYLMLTLLMITKIYTLRTN